MEINDEETLKKENITKEGSNKEFDTKIEKLNNLKGLIEKEMIEIDKAFEKVDNELVKSFEMKREKLKTEVTKVKSKFEKHLSSINNLIKTCYKITKGIK